MLEAEFVRLRTDGLELVPLTPVELRTLVRAPSEAERR